MFCKFCGAEIPSESAFCAKCGKPVEAMVAAENVRQEIAPVPPGPQGAAPPPPPPPPPPRPKPTGLVLPIIILIIAASGWLYILSSNSIQGLRAWFTSSQELQTSVSSSYNYFGNNTSSEELAGNIIFIVIMVLFTLLAVIGVIMLITRLARKFTPKRRPPMPPPPPAPGPKPEDHDKGE